MKSVDAAYEANVTLGLPILPLRDQTALPSLRSQLMVGRRASIRAVEEADHKFNGRILAVRQRNSGIDDVARGDLYDVGTVVQIEKIVDRPRHLGVSILGLQPATLLDLMPSADRSFHMGRVRTEAAWHIQEVLQHESYVGFFRSLANNEINLPSRLKRVLVRAVSSKEPERAVLKALMQYLSADQEHGQKLLNAFPDGILEYMDDVNLLWMRQQVKSDITNKARTSIEQNQREYFLREQIKEIHKELGQDSSEVELLEERLKEIELPDEARQRVERELGRLRRMPTQNPEASVITNYINTILDLPWSVESELNQNLGSAARILDQTHYSLNDPKERILESIAVSLLNNGARSPIFCLVGPPGTGKTTLAKAVAEATGRHYVKISLGGVHDEADIRGHRRTYIGALPGRIVNALRKAKANNPLILLDEVDKMGQSLRGDPASALLEVLDPGQNHAFLDHYLELEIDLSKAMFVCTANYMGNIPEPLRDRMELINLGGYTEREKLHIARNFLIPRAVEQCGLAETSLSVVFPEAVLLEIIQTYTQEAGVRKLEESILRIVRKIARQKVEGKLEKRKRVQVKAKELPRYLRKPRIDKSSLVADHPQTGIAVGLAWTESGGDVLPVEVSSSQGTRKLTVTGRQGEVMQESSSIAYSVVRSRAELPLSRFENREIHLHVPQGAVPKDGPSAGITMALAIYSHITGITVRHDVAMTGEISLLGRVLPIGGLKEKVLAATRHDIYDIIVPQSNRSDADLLEGDIIRKVHFHFVSTFDEVLQIALTEEIPHHDALLTGEHPETLQVPVS